MLNPYNEEARAAMAEALKDEKVLAKVIYAVAFFAASNQDVQLDQLLSGFDDELLGEYNSGFADGASEAGLSAQEILDGFANDFAKKFGEK